MGKAKKGKKNATAEDGDSDIETTNIESVKPSQTKSKKSHIEPDDSGDEKPKPKSKTKKTKNEDDSEVIKEVTKNIKNVSISNKSHKKKGDDSSEESVSVSKKSQKKKIDLSSEESDGEFEIKGKKGKKKDQKKSAFDLLEIEDAGDSPPEAQLSSEDDQPIHKPQHKINQEKPKEPAGKKSKKARRKKDDSDEDIDKVLAELEMEYTGVKKTEKAAEFEKIIEKPISEAPIEETPKPKKIKSKKEESKVIQEKEDHDVSDDEQEITLKSAAQKKKEKKEREKLKKQEAKKKEKEHEVKKENKADVKLLESKEPSEEKLPLEISKIDAIAASEEKEVEGEAVPAEGKKKKKADKSDKDEKGKKGPTKKTIAAMQEALKKVKEEEERLKQEEEERIKKEEERERQRLEAIRLEKERKERKKQKEKERKERLKAEGKLLTPKQRAEKARAQAMLQSLKAQGIEIGSVEKKPRPGTRLKPNRLKSQQSQETPPTPVEEKKVELEIVDMKIETEPEPELEEKKTESDTESVKDAWDAESSEEEPEPIKEEKKPVELNKSKVEKEEDEEEEESSEEDESSDDDSSSEEESDEEQLTDAQKKREIILKRLEKRREDNDKNRANNSLRAAVVCVLGHVDTGKTKILDKLRRTNVQDGEAGGITQQIGATNVPIENIKEQTKHVKGVTEIAFKLPGLLIIDTPGHESFSNLRNRGSSLCDIAILVVDIMHGLEPQTIESINLLKSKKTPFIVALNKIDRLYDWQSSQRKDIRDILKMQQINTQLEFDKRSKDVILQFAEQGLNAALFYENPDPRTYVSLVPTSAVTGEGMGNLLAMIVQACEGPLHKRLIFSEQLLATVLEVKAIPGLGTTIDTILINGTLHEGDTMVLAGTDGPIVTQIRSLLMPQPMKELRVKNAYIEHKEVVGAQGVKIAAKELEKAIAGLNLLVAQKPDEIDVLKEEVARELKTALSAIKLSERGVYVQASTLGSLEALLDFLRSSKIPGSPASRSEHLNLRLVPHAPEGTYYSPRERAAHSVFWRDHRRSGGVSPAV
ncbi:Eukaryotic translation initiation factor 5B [Eumeta japonica]|uniref:Eukaryotic translation initiation factor 5B n=1 Tax=Eumeta variegata TaxID=151549 RepID=A0A4C1UC85_EUMVA|nr:Eukaryotic translation initiation factor 5B [Eumeta japonica]